MPFIQWTNDFSVREEMMDKQHQMLFDYINNFCDAIDTGAGHQELVEAFNKIVAYTDFHFKDEERLLKDNDYPDYAVHKAIHEKLIADVMSFRKRLMDKEPNIETGIKQFLKLWLSAHIMGIDKKYSEFV